ncbi:hypothetical protein ACF0H5_008038 [Mactra antiquata]
MDEGGKYSNLCDLCCQDAKPAIRYCKNCVQKLCKDCIIIHARGRYAKDHSILDIEGKSYSKEVLDNIWKLYKCRKHQERIVEYLLNKSHDVVDKEDPILCYLYDRQHRRDKTHSKFRSDLSDVADEVKHRDIKLIHLRSVEDICELIRNCVGVQEAIETKYFEFGQLSGSDSYQNIDVSMKAVESNNSFEIGDADYAVCACAWLNESIVLASNVKNQLIMLDPLTQRILHTKKCESHPSSIVAVDQRNFAVCYDTNAIDIFKIQDQQLKHERTIKLNLEILAASMDEINNRLICLSPTTGQIAFVPLDKSLDDIQSVAKAAHDELDDSYDIDYDQKVNKIFVASHLQDKVISFDVHGERLSSCNKVNVHSPFAVTVDNMGSVYIVHTGGHCVLQYDRNLNFVRKLISETSNAKDPCCMAFNKDGKRFVIAGHGVKTWINVYNIT